jgi:hypothetical protein
MNINEKPGVEAGRFLDKKPLQNIKASEVFSQPKISVEADNWRPLAKNTLQGFFDLTVCGLGLHIKSLSLHSKNGKRWVSFPARAYTDKEGNQQWQSILEIPDYKAYQAFQDAALKAVDKLRGGDR